MFNTAPRKLLLQARRRLEPKLRRGGFPHHTFVDDFGHLVRFAVHNPTDVFRVEKHGMETHYLRMMLGRLTADDVFWDVGACVGLVTLHASLRCREVLAFEPDPVFRWKLERNIQLNRCNNITVSPTAVSDSVGKAALWTDGVSVLSPSLARKDGDQQNSVVPTETLDRLSDRYGSPTVVKIDIEGAEILALRGGTALLTGEKRPRILFVEIHPHFLDGFGATASDVIDLLGRCGYTETWSEDRKDQQLCVYEPSDTHGIGTSVTNGGADR